MSKTKKKSSLVRILLPVSLGLAAFTLLIYKFLQCNNIAILNPMGHIAYEQYKLIIFIVGVLLIVAVPTVILFFYTAWKFRESNTKAKYTPEARYGKSLDIGMWGTPFIFMLIIALVLWPATHTLEPQKQIASNKETLKIQVVALSWKWLFLYPEQKIATVNYVQIPVDRPVEFELTADEAPMSAFWIPNLGGMLYAMTGHVNKLNLKAEKPGDYQGSTAEINGKGFAGMKFTARASSEGEFNVWAYQTTKFPDKLDEAAYQELIKPSENNPPVYYSSYQSDLYDTVLAKYTGSSHGHGQKQTEHVEH